MNHDRPHGRSPIVRAGLFMGLALCLAACESGGPGESAGFTTRDSSGTTIIENTVPSWREGEGWRFSPEPLLDIGVMNGPDEYTLFRARGARRMEDGRIVLINFGTRELRFYDAQGGFLAAVGSNGEGPGEFRSPGFLWRTGADSLVVYDLSLRRFSVFDGSGVYGRSFLFSSDAQELAFPEGVFGDGSVLAAVDEQDQGNYTELGTVQGTMRFGRYGRDGSRIAALASLPGSELYKGTHPDGSGFTTSANHAVRPFTTVGPSTWYYGSGRRFEFQEWGMDGGLRKVVRLAKERRGMPEGVRAAWDESLREMNPQAAALWGNVPLPDSLPAHERLLLDPVGNLWVQGYTVLDEEPFWSVIDRTGRWLGDLAPPDDLLITEIGRDYLLGIWADTLGVQQVRMYGIEKGGSQP